MARLYLVREKTGGVVHVKGRDFYTGSKIYWRENRKKWQGVLYYKDKNGKQKTKSITLTSKKRESQEMFEKIKAELNEQMRVTPEVSKAIPMSSKTVRDRVGDYLRHLEDVVAMGNLEQSTLTNKRENATLYLLCEPIADMEYKSVTKDDVIDWITSVLDRGISVNTLNTSIGVLRQTYNWDLEQGKIASSPMTYVKSPKKTQKPVNYATDETLKRLNVYLDERLEKNPGDKIAICFKITPHTGLRGEELCGLRWKDVHFTTYDMEIKQTGEKRGKHPGYLTINTAIARNKGKPYVKETKTESGTRVLPMSLEVETILERYRDYTCLRYGVEIPNPNWFVFGEKEKFYNPSNLGNQFTYTARKQNLIGSDGRYLTLHGLRDTYATISVHSNAVDIKTLSSIMGHADAVTTLRRYVGYGDDRVKREAMTKVSKEIERKSLVRKDTMGKHGSSSS